MRATRLLAVAVLFSVVLQTTQASRLKFKTFGGNGLGETSGTAGIAAIPAPSGVSFGDQHLGQVLPYPVTGLVNYAELANASFPTDVSTVLTGYQARHSARDFDIWFDPRGLIRIQSPWTKNFITVKFRRLMDCDGQVAEGFATNGTWLWYGPYHMDSCSDRFGIPCMVMITYGHVYVRLSSGDLYTVDLYVDILTFNETGTITIGNSTLHVDNTTQLIHFTFGSWPFKTSSSCLYMALTVNAKGNGVYVAPNRLITVGSATIAVPNVAEVDSYILEDVQLYSSPDLDDARGYQGRVLAVFPYFGGSLSYFIALSPDGGLMYTTTAAPTKAAVGSSFSLTAILVTLLMLAFGLHQF